jgi:hypothetical protein
MMDNLEEGILDNAKQKVVAWIDKSVKFLHSNWDKMKDVTIREKKETVVAAHILQKMILGDDVSESEKRFLKAQSGDLIKILFLISLKFIPAPIPFTPIAIFLGKKVGINILPSSHELPVREDLRKWFGKGKWGGKDGGGWDRYNTKGERIGKCGAGEEGEAYAACLSSLREREPHKKQVVMLKKVVKKLMVINQSELVGIKVVKKTLIHHLKQKNIYLYTLWI